ncbi:methylated-DNA--[protein]-cysteine S-methyltransferase [Photobacterium sp. TY1-4]|uniref:methylated-DNA--[protein]-cysteine S-methyltransferase n=1 Tax=Photobacterium sp. TY1-4 TaxID=2899122 RepID=UPI0021BE4E87|nr:methylated-DNA--[protein]-cysteine S-methyltransferase [Photobacterium sp. TY1-4]UXI03447.1 methylated-DNA--[protein]-cysteine S-methyltransferase [Photobacterium sp. TY1-4]
MNNQHLDTPIGRLNIVANDEAVTAIEFDADPSVQQVPNAITRLCCEQLSDYFAGNRTDFDVPLDAHGTRFQHQVWQALIAIPYGETCSYSAIAHQINNPKAVRAVGAANGRNPIPVIVPCHRVIGSSGQLTGYAGGLDIKIWLIEHERRISS